MTVYPGPYEPERRSESPGTGSSWQPEPEQGWSPEPEPPPHPQPHVEKRAPESIESMPMREINLAFAPLNKRAFGVAVGTGAAVLVIAVTLFHVLIHPEGAPRIELLRAYFYRYTVSLQGAAIGGAWAFVVGFVMGWFVAFCRNLAIATSIFITRTRAELSQTRDFLDHI
jgi:hypothetical protein